VRGPTHARTAGLFRCGIFLWSPLDYSGRSISAAGDINGDGIDDLTIGALGADPNGYSCGASYVVFGSTDGFAASLGIGALLASGQALPANDALL
jgi:hypothetical protein